MANNLKDYGSFIPGYRPGGRTAAYLEQVMVRITYVGAAFLALVAIIPTIVANSLQIDYLVASFYGGTGLLILRLGGAGSGAEDRQPSGDAELSRPVGSGQARYATCVAGRLADSAGQTISIRDSSPTGPPTRQVAVLRHVLARQQITRPCESRSACDESSIQRQAHLRKLQNGPPQRADYVICSANPRHKQRQG